MQGSSESLGVVVLVMLGFVAVSVVGQLVKVLFRVGKK